MYVDALHRLISFTAIDKKYDMTNSQEWQKDPIYTSRAHMNPYISI